MSENYHPQLTDALLENPIRLLIDAIPQIVWVGDKDSKVEFFNSRWFEYTGLARDLIDAADFSTVIHADDLPHARRALMQAHEQGSMVEVEYRLKSKEGEYRWFLARSIPIKDESGKIIWRFGTATDIHEHVLQKQMLEASERHFKEFVETLPFMAWTADNRTDEIFYNQSFYRFHGVKLGDSLPEWQDAVHPDDLPLLSAAHMQVVRTGEAAEGEFRIKGAAGVYRWHLLKSVGIKNASGQVIRQVGTAVDIHNQKQLNDRVQQIADSIPQIVWTTDLNGATTYFNRRWWEYTGLNEGSYEIGATAIDIIHPDDRETVIETWRRGYLESKAIECQYRILSRDGSYRWFLGRLVPLRDEEQVIQQWYGTATDIESQKQVEIEYRLLTEAVPNFVWRTNSSGQIEFANPAFTAYTGFTVEEANAKGWAGLIHPEDLESVGRDYLVAKIKSTSYQSRFRLRRKDGQYRWMIRHALAVPNSSGKGHSWVGTTTDIDDVYRAQKEVEEKQALLKLVMDAAPFAIVYIDRDERFVVNNAYFERNYEQNAGQLVGKSVNDVLGVEVYDRIRNHLEHALRGETVSFEAVLEKEAGVPHTVHSTLVPDLDPKGQIRGVVAISQDITERKKAEVTNAELLKSYQHALFKAEEASRAKTEFLANMSHEIRTPLSAILGFSELMKDLNTSLPERIKFADVINRNGRRLSTLINDILDMSKVEVRKLDIEEIPMSVSGVLFEVIQLLSAEAELKGISIAAAPISPALPDRICSDPTRIYQILSNLLVNALKFTHHGQISVEVGSRMEAGQLMINFKVTDTGIGISVANRKRLFTPFSQADNSLSRMFGGTGLGLALSKRLCELLGGNLILESSEEGVGSTFVASIRANLHLLKQHIAGDADRSKAVPDESKKPLAGIRVLLAEDSPDNQVLIKRFLTAAGATVELARNGLEAFEQAIKSDFDIILMDIQMPILDGYSATQRLRKIGYSKPIVALTAHALKEEQERSIREGCNQHLTKPINRQLLLAEIGRFVFGKSHPV